MAHQKDPKKKKNAVPLSLHRVNNKQRPEQPADGIAVAHGTSPIQIFGNATRTPGSIQEKIGDTAPYLSASTPRIGPVTGSRGSRDLD
ncbi:hypothetical protein HYALB_00009608 [Hymenoscyphus albidus]|uniref:Uncharacterized protein n=1 Tax=Hymenoscyphus albidus TaxID=595503 RepID=A0A9N9M1K1_9HELO|nr:hypothetical protein HYALB_00009608 [Hymenoscyphus albidus]